MTTKWPVWIFVAGLVAAIGALTFALVRYPGMLDDPQIGAWLAILAGVVGAYLAVAVVALVRPTSPATRTGVAFGAVAGVAWLGEMWFQAPARLAAQLERPVAGGFALAAAVVTIAAGITEGARTGGRRRAAWAGVWAGLVSATIMVTGLIAIQLSNLGLLGARADYQAELARSGYPDMATYLASDAVAASLMHMVLNVVLGAIGAGVGVLVARAMRPAATTAGGAP